MRHHERTKALEKMKPLNGVKVEMSAKFSCAEIMSLEPNQIRAFMQGVSEVLAVNERAKPPREGK